MGLLIWMFRFVQVKILNEIFDEDFICVILLFQYIAFAISGSKLTQRIRSKAFDCLLRQEVAYFDRPENSPGAICSRLYTDASSVQQMTGTRLGLICETLALIFFGLLFGILLSWQLTLIALSPLLLLIPAMYLSVRLEMWLNNLCDSIREQANMVKSNDYLFDKLNI
jgi:ABC-type bacteriocin/lantibiotic exporter with double-glycine peptidase domain